MRLGFVVLLLLAVSADAAEIKGKVANAENGEALERVEVAVLEARVSTVTSKDGEFDILNLPPGHYTLRLNAVSYRLLTVPFTLSTASDVKEFSITMVPDNFHRTDRVEVHGDVFQLEDSPATAEMNLTASEIRETSTVFADDPFRAVQTLPGVSAEGNNEFFAEFSVMGAPFSSVSVYIDGVLVENPFHEIGNFSTGASLGVLTGEVVEDMKLMPAAYPEMYGDEDGAALDIHTREGSRGTPLFRLSAGIAASEILGEGKLGAARKGSWLLSARKSYINYLIRGRVENAADVGFEDADLRLNYNLTPRQEVSLFATDGHTNMAMSDAAALQDYEYANGNSDFTLSRAGWRSSPGPHLLIESHGAYLREPDQLFNNTNLILTKSDYREWVGGAGISWAWASDHVFQAGASERQVRDSQYQAGFTVNGSLQSVSTAASGLRQSGYLQQSSAFLHHRAHVLASVRLDSLSGYSFHPISPQISLALQATRATQFEFGAGRYQQFLPPLEEIGVCSPLGFMPEKSDHLSAAIEQRLGENTRIRLQAFDREDNWGLGLVEGFQHQVVPLPCPSFAPLANSTYQRDYSRGAQLILQRRSANRLSGWLGYTFAIAKAQQYEVNEPVSPGHIFLDTPSYPTLDDQRHTLNAFAMYRLRPSLSLSGKFLYGSGFPVPSGTYVQVGNGQYAAVGINQTRLGVYERLDIRADKDWAFQRWKLTLYAEILNLTNHYNPRYFYESGINQQTGQATVQTLQGLPLTPTAGLVFQF
jgi:hypothetical protein